ncbi:TetR/AcrR family transcriptional regulator [Serinibacter salmoneus]|uniref:TetR family transcriptional regulator n=1 Tax=Serinibacter salmoneus TaxID=556530 RepID=A0A2A9CVP9_9MICO|nr:TetR family transcriptional regulator [Serinibacter salmoneus]PFG18483.1 TetR family transcriptional regulator [Serinibacter salmoneus]
MSRDASEPRGPGRRPAGQDTRGAVLRAAREEFAEKGVDGASMRSIARRAGVDPGTVRHWFANREELVAASVIPRELNPAEQIRILSAPGLTGLGRRIAETVLGAWDEEGGPARFRILVAGLSSTDMHDVLAPILERSVIPTVSDLVPDPDPRRFVLVLNLLGGTLLMRHVFRIEPTASLPLEVLVATVGDAIQRALEDPL